MATTYKSALHEYACKHFKRDMRRLLEDPTSIDKPVILRSNTIPFFRKVAVQLGLNFEVLIREGTPFEQERLRRIESGRPHDNKSINDFLHGRGA